MKYPTTVGYETSHTAPFHPAIHNMGNVGFLGRAHAQGAWFATRMIDHFAYNGRNMRAEIAEELTNHFSADASVLEVGCGAGTLTYELLRAGFGNVTAIDTSRQMLSQARVNAPGALYVEGNGVSVSCDAHLAIVSFVMHEMPRVAHEDLLEQLACNTKSNNGEIVLVDIDPVYKASGAMLAGEPYVPEYLLSIQQTIEDKAELLEMSVQSYAAIEGHVRVWKMQHVEKMSAVFGRSLRDPIFSNVDEISNVDESDQNHSPGGVEVANVKTALEVLSMCVALDYDCCLFIYMRGCPYCVKLTSAWNKACKSEAKVLWLVCMINNFDSARSQLGSNITFPCLVANGHIHEKTSDQPTSAMSMNDIIQFAQTDPPASEEAVVFVNDDESVDLLSAHDSEESDNASSCGSTSIGDDEIPEDFEDEPGVEEEFLATCSASDAAKATGDNPAIVVFKWDACGGCDAFKTAWNEAVRTAPQRLWAVVDVDESPDLFEETGSTTVPHLQRFSGNAVPMAAGPMDIEELLQWAGITNGTAR